MRLTPQEIAAIKASACEAFGADVIVRLFGSRLDDHRRGGDIDLYIVSTHPRANEKRARFHRLLSERVGEREYDILIAAAGPPLSPIDRKAQTEGIVL